MSTATLDIPAILEQARSGDTGAFAQIVRQYQSLVSGVLYNATGDFHKSEDIAQETFLIAWQKLGELREPQHLAAWLCTIARNLAHHSHRKPAISTKPLSEETGGLTPAALVSNSPAPDAELLRREQSELVWSAIGEIDEKHRETLVLYYRSGQSVKEIAGATESTEEAVRQRLVRARKSLKSKIEEMVGDILTDTAPGEVFTMTVMTALGVTMLSTTAAAATGTIATGTAIGTGATGKASGTALGAATMWTAIGPIAYFGCFIAMWYSALWVSVRNAPTLHARRFRVYSIFWTLQHYPLFCVVATFVCTSPMFAYSWSPEQRTLVLGATFCFMFLFIFLLCIPLQQAYHQKMKRIVENDIGLPRQHVESYSYQQVERQFFLSIITNLLLAITLLAFVMAAAAREGDIASPEFLIVALCTTVLVALMTTIYYRLGRYFLEICRTKQNFLVAGPLVDNPFETALGTSGKASASVDHPKKMGHMFGVLLFGGITFVLGLIWFLSNYSWDKHPITLGICVLTFITFFAILPKLLKPVKCQKKKVSLLGYLYIFTMLAFIVSLECIEFGGFYLWEVWNQSGSGNSLSNNSLRISHRVMFFIAALALVFLFFHDRKAKQRESSDKDSNREELLREAIARYNPAEMIADEPEITAKPFPRRWIWIIGLYAAALVVLWCVGVWGF